MDIGKRGYLQIHLYKEKENEDESNNNSSREKTTGQKLEEGRKSVGLGPIMGFLHEGHAGVIKKCREENDIVVVSDL